MGAEKARNIFSVVAANSALLLIGCNTLPDANLNDPANAAIISFEAKPSVIRLGEATTISWQTEGVTSVSIEPYVGIRSPQGSVNVQPIVSTTYTLRIDTVNGSTTKSLKIEVISGTPVINQFSATPTEVTEGESVTLQWATSNTTRVVIAPDVGETTVSGSQIVSPQTTTTYRLIAMSDTEMTMQELTVTVVASEEPIIRSFTVSPMTVSPGQPATLSWQTTNSDSVSINNNVGVNLAATGTVEINPNETTTYTLTAYRRSQSKTAQVTVVVQQNGPTIISLTANPETITAGESTTISWQTTNTTEVTFDNGIGRKATTGSVVVSPMATTTYTMTAAGAGGQSTRTITIQVNSPDAPHIDSFRASATMITPGQSVVLSWQTTDADTVSIDNGIGNQPVDGQTSVTPMATTTYRLQATNVAGSTNQDITITVSSGANGDTCASAISVAASGGNYQGTTVGAVNDYEPPRSCAGYPQIAPDYVYKSNLSAGTVVTANVEFPMSLDGSLYVVTDCSNLATSCVTGADQGLSGAPETIRFVAEQSSDHFFVVDGALSGSTGTHNLDINIYVADSCSNAAPLNITGNGEFFTTANYMNDYNLPNNSMCTGFSSNGLDRVYQVDLQPYEQLAVELAPSTAYDPAMYLVSSCSSLDANCVEGSDRGLGQNERIQPIIQQAGTYYLVLDSFAANSSGSGVLTADINRGDTCDDAYVVPKGTSQFRGTTVGYSADYGKTNATNSCTNWSQSGPDAVFRIELDPNETLTASLDSGVSGTTWDAALYLISDCAQSATTCLTGEDNGNPETISYQNTGMQPATYFLIVDSFLASRSGVFELDVTIN
ncbi:MAG: hypothetical protein VYC39_04575 [Myxococcota bacterium]|nr:hypothetical protein [Myxococcota bacterium]